LARGQVPADIVFVGEAPGASENFLGQPFVGPAGDLLQQIIKQALPPDIRYALTNLVACFPAEAKARGDNEPEQSEILACRPRLVEFINLCRPRLIVCVGTLASNYLPRESTPTANIVHPAAILRMPKAQKNMAAERSIMVLLGAVQKMLQSSYIFTNWRNNAEFKQATYHSMDKLGTGHSAGDIPF
jgi:uracil-DNA glycosylase